MKMEYIGICCQYITTYKWNALKCIVNLLHFCKGRGREGKWDARKERREASKKTRKKVRKKGKKRREENEKKRERKSV